jgi:GT2 family glycosyltransferase
MKPKTMPKVAVLILNFNGRHLLFDCLSSLRKTRYPNFEAYIVDNGSVDGSLEYASEVFPWAKQIPLLKNYGFCEAYNRASELVDSDLLLFLNNDVKIAEADWLENMVNVLLANSKVAAVGARLLLADSPETIENVGGSFLRWQGGRRIGYCEKNDSKFSKPLEPFYVSGAALLIKRQTFFMAGCFDSKMFAFSEDLDLCWRLRLMGFKIVYCPKAAIIHKCSASFKRSPQSFYLSHRNFLRASIKNYSPGNMIKHLPPLFTISMIFGFAVAILSGKGDFLMSVLKSTWFNLLNLNSTLKARQFVQNKRQVQDSVVFAGSEVNNIERVSEILKKLELFN